MASILALELLLIGFIFPGKARAKAFTKKFMEENFLEEHQAAIGDRDIGKGGYPDAGNGRYSQKLSYKEWFDFNNAQRAHYNFLEMAPSTFLWLLIAGVYYPCFASVVGLLTGVFRLHYAYSYATKGAQGRRIGAIGNDLMILALFGASICSGWSLAQGKAS